MNYWDDYEFEYQDYHGIPRTKIDSIVDGQWERMLAKDAKGRRRARVLEYEPGVDTTPLGVQSHDYREEIVILEGSLTDLTLNETFYPGYVASRPLHQLHGPWKTDEGCIMFEIDVYPED